MAKYVRRHLSEMESHGGGAVRLARKSLGVTAFGMQVFTFGPGMSTLLRDESASGQEEVYPGLGGGGWVEVDGERSRSRPRSRCSCPRVCRERPSREPTA